VREFDPTLTQHHTFLFLWLFLNMAISHNNLTIIIIIIYKGWEWDSDGREILLYFKKYSLLFFFRA